MSQIITCTGGHVCVSRESRPIKACVQVQVGIAERPDMIFEREIFKADYEDFEREITRTILAAEIMLSALAGLPDSRIGGIL